MMVYKNIVNFSIMVVIYISVAKSAEELTHRRTHTVNMEKMVKRNSFVKIAQQDRNYKHELIFAIQQQNIPLLEAMVVDRSTPSHDLYQKWLTFDEVGSIIHNSIGLQAVETWLASFGITPTWRSPRGEYVKVTANISMWEMLLDTKFYVWHDISEDGEENSHHTLAEYYSLPEYISRHLSAVLNACQAPPIIKKHFIRKSKDQDLKTNFGIDESKVDLSDVSRMLAGCASSGGAVTVSFLNCFYQIGSNAGTAQLSQSVFETASQYFSPSDLTNFQQRYGLPIQAAQNVGGYATTAPCSTSATGSINCNEGNLDIQYIMGLAQSTVSVYWYVDISGNPFVTWATDAASQTNPPAVNSISWGMVEQDNAASVMSTFNTEALKLASMGVTVVVSSGDNGVANQGCSCRTTAAVTTQNCACQASSNTPSYWTGTAWPSGSGYFPSFPASSPYVTAVGATMGPNTGSPEVACQSQLGGVITTGGGFSTYYPAPSWQAPVTAAYFSGLGANQPAPGYNPRGRGYPDISLIGVNYQVVIAGSLVSTYGTSCSAPAFAAMVSLINAQRYRQNLPTIGFLNPTLYSAAARGQFNDITSGLNKCCAYSGSNPSSALCCASGFSATPGWDPVTGFGSINFPRLASMFNISSAFIPPTAAPSDGPVSKETSHLLTIIIAVVILLTIASAVIYAIARIFCNAPPLCGSRPAPPVDFAPNPLPGHESTGKPAGQQSGSLGLVTLHAAGRGGPRGGAKEYSAVGDGAKFERSSSGIIFEEPFPETFATQPEAIVELNRRVANKSKAPPSPPPTPARKRTPAPAPPPRPPLPPSHPSSKDSRRSPFAPPAPPKPRADPFSRSFSGSFSHGSGSSGEFESGSSPRRPAGY